VVVGTRWDRRGEAGRFSNRNQLATEDVVADQSRAPFELTERPSSEQPRCDDRLTVCFVVARPDGHCMGGVPADRDAKSTSSVVRGRIEVPGDRMPTLDLATDERKKPEISPVSSMCRSKRDPTGCTTFR